MTKNLGYLLYIGDDATQLYGDYFINHEIRIPINQPSKMKNLFFRGSPEVEKNHGRFRFGMLIQENYGTPPAPLTMKGLQAYSLLVKGCVPNVCWNNRGVEDWNFDKLWPLCNPFPQIRLWFSGRLHEVKQLALKNSWHREMLGDYLPFLDGLFDVRR